jgi:polyisoprenoid-binding protein YceI
VIIDGAEAIGDGQYRTDAELTLKGVTKSVALTFTLTETDGIFHVDARGELKRQDFKFTGGGPKNMVPLTVAADLLVAK